MTSNEIIFSCPYCPKRTADPSELRIHMNFGRPTPCRHCGKNFGCVTAALDHIDVAHRQASCTCGREPAGWCGMHRYGG